MFSILSRYVLVHGLNSMKEFLRLLTKLLTATLFIVKGYCTSSLSLSMSLMILVTAF